MEPNYLQIAKAVHGAGLYADIDAQRVIACALVSIAASLETLAGGAGGRPEDQPF